MTVKRQYGPHGTSAWYNKRKCRCEECVAWARNYHSNRVTTRRDAWFAANGPCAHCKSWERLELDHIERGEKNNQLLGKRGSNQDIWKWPKVRQDEELAKCQALCRICHRKKSSVEMTKPLVHGTTHGYRRRKCRCDDCCQAMRDQNRMYYRNRRGKS